MTTAFWRSTSAARRPPSNSGAVRLAARFHTQLSMKSSRSGAWKPVLALRAERRVAVGDRGGDPVVGGGDAQARGFQVRASGQELRGDALVGRGWELGQRAPVAGEGGAGRGAHERRELMLEDGDARLGERTQRRQGRDLLALLIDLGGGREALPESQLDELVEGPARRLLRGEQVEELALGDDAEPDLGDGTAERDGQGLVVLSGRLGVELGGALGAGDLAPEIDLVAGADAGAVARALVGDETAADAEVARVKDRPRAADRGVRGDLRVVARRGRLAARPPPAPCGTRRSAGRRLSRSTRSTR